MASKEQVENQKELNRLKQEQLNLENKSNESLEYASIAFKNIVDEIRGGNDQLKIADQLQKSRVSSLTKSSNLARQLLEVAKGESTLSKKQLENIRSKTKAEQDNLERILLQRDGLNKVIDGRTVIGRQIKQEIADLEAVLYEQTQIENTIKDTNKALGFAPALAGGFDKALQKAGLPALGISQALEDTHKEAQAATGDFEAMGTFTKKVGANIKSAASLTNMLQIGFALVVKSALKLNKIQTDFRRLTGESATNINTLNSALISTSDQLQTMVSLTDTFGFNANMAFDAINIQEATELVELMGLSAEEAGNLAYFAQASGDNLKDAASNIYDGVSAGFSQKKILQDIGKVSNSIALTFGGNLEAMGRTADEAKKLGLNLSQVDKIASGLLDIESSIAAEYQAEVISGKQLELGQARMFALTNNMEGLTKEIGKNQSVIDSFATGNRIEQEATAEALGLSRDEMSKMVFDQAIINEMSTEEAAVRAGMGIEDAKRLTLQTSITKSVEKLTEALAGPLEAFASLASNSLILYSTLGLIASISLARTIASLVAMGSTLAANAIAAGATSSALSLGLAIPAIILGVALLGGSLAAMYSESKRQIKTGDAILPASGGPIISTMEGGIFQGTRNDDVLMGPGLAKGGRNQGLSKEDVNAIASAVRDGASSAQINLDGGRVSNRIQPPLAMNTRKYSV